MEGGGGGGISEEGGGGVGVLDEGLGFNRSARGPVGIL